MSEQTLQSLYEPREFPEIIQKKLKTLPEESGVYIMKNADGEVIYVGKAISLKRRVRQYFQSSRNHEPKVRAMVSHIADFETVVTKSELEALILECNFIKEYRPRYNILLRDDKQYPFVRIDFTQDYPRIEIARRMGHDKAKYYGPFRAAHSVHDIMQTLADIFPIRTCKRDLKEGVAVGRPCLNYQIGKCLAPCRGCVPKEEYHAMMQQAAAFLSGKGDALIEQIRQQMLEASEKLQFEKAAQLRDRMIYIESVLQKQIVTSTAQDNRDIIGIAPGGGKCLVQVLFMRNGKIAGSSLHEMQFSHEESESEIIENFLLQYYESNPEMPKEILVPILPEEWEVLQELFSEQNGRKVYLLCPKRGEKKQLLDMAQENAMQERMRREKRDQEAYEHTRAALAELCAVCGLSEPPHRIEGYDISNIQGVYSVASMVVFEDGKPAKHAYRRFRIKTVEGANDFASHAEVLTRRFMRQKQGDDKFLAMPDLIMIDGGKGQLSSACEALDALGISLPICSLAEREEEIYLPNREAPIRLPRTSGALQTLQRLRDEAHRFAITYHRSLRSKKSLGSVLEEIEGVGPKRRTALLRHFKTMEAMEKATLEELSAVSGVTKPAALAVFNFLHPHDSNI